MMGGWDGAINKDITASEILRLQKGIDATVKWLGLPFEKKGIF